MGSTSDERESLLEGYRSYLHLLARLEVEGGLQGKIDLSGVVQQTLLEAHQAEAEFRGQSKEQRLAWLRRILANNLRDAGAPARSRPAGRKARTVAPGIPG